jgi:hypothetical protein
MDFKRTLKTNTKRNDALENLIIAPMHSTFHWSVTRLCLTISYLTNTTFKIYYYFFWLQNFIIFVLFGNSAGTKVRSIQGMSHPKCEYGCHKLNRSHIRNINTTIVCHEIRNVKHFDPQKMTVETSWWHSQLLDGMLLKIVDDAHFMQDIKINNCAIIIGDHYVNNGLAMTSILFVEN